MIMLKRYLGMFCALSFVALLGIGCDGGNGTKAGSGGSIGTKTGGTSGSSGGTSGETGGVSGETGGTSGETGGTSGATGGAGGSSMTPTQIHMGIINAPAAAGVTTLDPSVAGTPKVYSNGVCQ
jgi:hypothetical protein